MHASVTVFLKRKCSSSCFLMAQQQPRILVFGHSVEEILSNPDWQGERDLDALEIFAGVESVKTAADDEGLRAMAIDKDKDAVNHDLTTETGFLYVCSVLMMVVVNGLCWIAPVCSSMGFPNSKNTKRTKKNPEGDLDYLPNQVGNHFATVAAFFVQMCRLRSIHWVIENPRGSFIFMTSYLQPTLQWATPNWRICTVMCAFSQGKKKIMKPLTLVGSHQWIVKMKRTCSCKNGHLQTMPLNANGKPCGSPALKGSQAYTRMFGRQVVKYFLESTGKKCVTGGVQQPMAWTMDQSSSDEEGMWAMQSSSDFAGQPFTANWAMQINSDSDGI